MRRSHSISLITLAALTTTGAARARAPFAKGDIPFPHPVITEVLFNVPSGPDGDANQDGERHAAGDEFVELYNPHDRRINLRGYRITDKPNRRGGQPQLDFTFPECWLEPGQFAVVFNGKDATIPGPVGTSSQAAAPHPGFDRARVFTMGVTSGNTAWSNRDDFVLLAAPGDRTDGVPLDAIIWGFPDRVPPGDTLRVTSVGPGGSIRGSVHRTGAGAETLAHAAIDGTLFSPGRLPAPP